MVESGGHHGLVLLQRKTRMLQVSAVTTCCEGEVEVHSMFMVQLQPAILSRCKRSIRLPDVNVDPSRSCCELSNASGPASID